MTNKEKLFQYIAEMTDEQAAAFLAFLAEKAPQKGGNEVVKE